MWRAAAFALAALLTGPALAQGEPFYSPVLVIDQDRLFEETRVGATRSAEIEGAVRALAIENREIEAALIEEERSLVAERETMPAESFSDLARAFDEKVQRIREEQDQKSQTLDALREDARQAFFLEVGDILSQIVRERRAVLVLDTRDVFLSADPIDITDEAIARVNARFQDQTPEPGDEPAGNE